MKKMPAGKFKTSCLQIMDDVRRTKNPVLITKRGRPVAKLVPADSSSDDFIGRLEGVVKIVGDIESPVEPLESWEALRWSYSTPTPWYGPLLNPSDCRERQPGPSVRHEQKMG